MAYKRNYRKKRYNRRRRFSSKWKKKMMLKPRMGGKLRQPIHYFTRHVDLGTITTTTGQAFTVGRLTFKLSDVPNYTEFTALYDSYIIKAVKVSFIPADNVSDGTGFGTTTNSYYYRFISAIDYEDNTTPGALNDLRQYTNCKVTPFNRIHKRFFHPRSLNTIDEDGSTGGGYNFGINGKWAWINTGANQTQFMCLKYGFEHLNQVPVVTSYRVEAKYYMCFKGQI